MSAIRYVPTGGTLAVASSPCYGLVLVSAVLIEPTTIPTSLELPGSIRFSESDFVEICRRNPDRHIELEANGDITIMAPSGGETSRMNGKMSLALGKWAEVHGGIVLDSSGGFRLPNGAIRSPDAAWFATERWEAVSLAEREGFPNLAPDFLIELVSPSDTLARQIAKMEEYAANGVRLGWLVIPATREVRIHRPGHTVPEIHLRPDALSAGPEVLPGFVLDFAPIW